MKTYLQVLSEDEKSQVHERSLEILAKTGIRVDTATGRQLLESAGAEVNQETNLVRIPRKVVEECLQVTAKNFSLGARRPGWDLEMNAGNFTLCADGEGIFVVDAETGDRRPSTSRDWQKATRLIDAVDEIGIYWSMVERSDQAPEPTPADQVEYFRKVFSNFSKHIQDPIPGKQYSTWLLEILQIIFGDKETIRKTHPYSFLLCPQSPLVIDQKYTDAYLALLGWDIPVAIMPMPLMGGTAPGSLISTIILGNCEVLAALCMIQAGAPGTPIIYAPVLALSNLRSGGYSAGAIESGLTGAASTEMARYYGLPAEASGGGTSRARPGIQGAYERALNSLLPVLSWPDILVGPGLTGGSTHLSLEQLLIDVEVYKMGIRTHQGIASGEGHWLDDVIQRVGPAGYFMGDKSTVESMRAGEWYLSDFGWHGSYEEWRAMGKPSVIEETRQRVDEILNSHQPLPLSPEMERELDHLFTRAKTA
ncbi:MAG: trimethylamine methyltransferase family protein [Chloroflexota bacterium]|nr:MAG: trimethylamine methyltransferase family protein [Chloroflexota bacterium]